MAAADFCCQKGRFDSAGKNLKKYKIEIKTLLCIKLNRLSAILQRVSYTGRGVWEAGEFFETSPSQELRLNGCGLISQSRGYVMG